MNSFIKRYPISFFLVLALVQSAFPQRIFPEKGTYDGMIGNDKIVLIAETGQTDYLKGYFVLNRGKAVEESHSFSFTNSGTSPFFQSDLFVGNVKKGNFETNSFEGTLTLLNKKRRFLFFRPKAKLSFVRRPETAINPTERYQNEIFDRVEVKSDLLYGKAKGYWTSSPYSDEPYITTLSKGLVKSFKDSELLDLKLDVYYPKSDLFKNRPLVMLIHGGAFYIGSKESAAEKALATTLAKRGYVVASIDYRLGFKLLASDIELSGYRAIQDAQAALRFLAHNAKGLGIDPNQVYVGGTSAGGVASLNVAFMDEDELPARIQEGIKQGTLSKMDASGNKYDETYTIKAVANMWGAVSDLNIIDQDEKASVISIHGTADDIVPFEYDFPFKNSLMINRLIMDKMYGSKPIHDRLKILGNRNRLISLIGMNHEPELDNFNTLNKYMDTISYQVSRFFYEETAPSVVLPASQLKIPENADLKTFYYEVKNGTAVQISATGGVKAIADPTDASIIWIRNAVKKELIFDSVNPFEAWNRAVFPVNVLK
ncbi:MAG: alpha/beta hydrolase [Prolixibacteraceae bacterium]